MTTALTAPSSDASVYGSLVDDHEAKFERARRSVARERKIEREHRDSIETKLKDVLEAYLSAPEDWSDNQIARSLDLNPSTMRSMIPREHRRAQRRARARDERE